MMRTETSARRLTPLLFLLGLGAAGGLSAQVLPPHPPLRVLVVSDEVNPHGLSGEDLRPSAGGIVNLFASDYDGGNHLLGYVEGRPQWRGLVMVYQPGKHQPNALQPGNNFQVLLNGIVFLVGPLFADGFESGDLSRWTLNVGGTP